MASTGQSGSAGPRTLHFLGHPRVRGSGLWGFRLQGLGFGRFWGLGFRFWEILWFGVSVCYEFRVWETLGLGFRYVKSFGFRSSGKSVEGSGLSEKVPTNRRVWEFPKIRGYLILGSL